MANIFLMYSESYASIPPYRDPDIGTLYTYDYVCDVTTGSIYLITGITDNPENFLSEKDKFDKKYKQQDAIVLAEVDDKKIIYFPKDNGASDAFLKESFDAFTLRALKDDRLLNPQEVAKVFGAASLTQNNSLDNRQHEDRLWRDFDTLVKNKDFTEDEILKAKRAYSHFYKIPFVEPSGPASPSGPKPPQYG